MNKLLTIWFVLVPTVVLACPNCNTGLGEENRPPWTLIILGVFVALIYIPFFILFRAAKKYDPKN